MPAAAKLGKSVGARKNAGSFIMTSFPVAGSRKKLPQMPCTLRLGWWVGAIIFLAQKKKVKPERRRPAGDDGEIVGVGKGRDHAARQQARAFGPEHPAQERHWRCVGAFKFNDKE
jgi:hypothetical protein